MINYSGCRQEASVSASLDGKVAIVTGAGSQNENVGNGRAAAVLLAEAGAKVVLVDLYEGRVNLSQEMIAQHTSDILALTADVSKLDECERVLERTVQRWGAVDVLVNNVGVIGPPGPITEVDPIAWDECFRINVNSMMYMSRLVIPYMEAQGSGAIVNVSSVAAMRAYPRVAYAATKGAIISMTQSMAVMHGPAGIRINCVAPGFAFTPIVQEAGLTEAARQERIEASALKVEGTGWDVARSILFLSSDLASWITGEVLTVDGGYRIN